MPIGPTPPTGGPPPIPPSSSDESASADENITIQNQQQFQEYVNKMMEDMKQLNQGSDATSVSQAGIDFAQMFTMMQANASSYPDPSIQAQCQKVVGSTQSLEGEMSDNGLLAACQKGPLAVSGWLSTTSSQEKSSFNQTCTSATKQLEKGLGRKPLQPPPSWM